MLISTFYENLGKEQGLGTLSSIEVIQSLWSGYGELVRLVFQEKSIIVKHIKLPKTSKHPRGWNTDLSHQRKLHSYQVEVSWYEKYSSKVDNNCRISQGLKCFQKDDEWLIVMEDLASLGLEYVVKEATKNHLKACLSWLANFHAKYMGTKDDSLWKIGTYWHLDTRPHELEALEDIELKNSAKQIDTILNNTMHQTIVHGDAKLANFCFDKSGSRCAAVDFQYVGHGCGMKDVAYFMGSAIEPEDCEMMEELVLDTYFLELKSALRHYQPSLESSEIEKEWRAMFVMAWADFQRFIKGWSPGHFKINSYTDSLTKRALKKL